MSWSRGPSIVYANRVHLSITPRGALQMLRRIAALKCQVRKIHLLTPGGAPGAAADMSGSRYERQSGVRTSPCAQAALCIPPPRVD